MYMPKTIIKSHMSTFLLLFYKNCKKNNTDVHPNDPMAHTHSHLKYATIPQMNTTCRNVLFAESFYGGSHRHFADGLNKSSRHNISLAAMPARYWKWRLKGAGFHFYRNWNLRDYDCLFVTSMTDVSQLKALERRCPPVILYMHENQLTYPRPKGVKRDMHAEMLQVSSCLSADRILFNSEYHRNAFFEALPAHLRSYPEYRPDWIIPRLKKKSGVLYPGLAPEDTPLKSGKTPPGPPHILWNHRWEFDKQPQVFFSVLKSLKEEGVPFRLSLLGECAMIEPTEFLKARETFKNELVHFGYVPSHGKYLKLLASADITVSTAIQENFGISVMEALRAGLYPLLPDRLSYPELIPAQFHPSVLYRGKKHLLRRLTELCTGGLESPESANIRSGLKAAADQYAWNKMAGRYDAEIDAICGGNNLDS